MKAIILAAGRGSRMKNLTDERPKCLVELHGQPLLDRQIAAIKQAGIDSIAIVTGYRKEMLDKYDLYNFHNQRWSETNMLTSLSCADKWLSSSNCIVSYSDIFYEPTAITSLMGIPNDLAIAYDINWLQLWKSRFTDPLTDAETFRLHSDGCLAEIGGKAATVEEIQGQYMGLLRFTPKGWTEVRRLRQSLDNSVRDNLDMTAALNMILDAGNLCIGTTPYYEKWGEIDSADDLECYI